MSTSQAPSFFRRIPPSGEARRTYWKTLFRLIAGWSFIMLGILGLFLPVLQGILFLALGIYLLSPHIPLFHRLQQRLNRRYPRLKKRVHHMRDAIKSVGYRRIRKE